MDERIRSLLCLYDGGIEANGVEVKRWGNPITKRERLEHLRWMIQEMAAEIESTQADEHRWSGAKLNRWLGFIQGTLQAEGMVSIGMLRDQSRGLSGDVLD